MFQWYESATRCIIYLADVPSRSVVEHQEQLEAFAKSRWFRRGWCLQELIASQFRVFYSEDWSLISQYTLGLESPMEDTISSITGIDIHVLHSAWLKKSYCVAERMSWAAGRETTRPEDRAYSLMGLFDVQMPILYGEGLQNAFARLLDEIMKTSFDQTIFAWRGPYEESGLLAPNPDVYQDTPTLRLWRPDYLSPYSMTNTGLQIRPFIWKHAQGPSTSVFAALQCNVKADGWKIVFVELKQVEDAFCTVNGVRCKAYRRINCHKWFELDSMDLVGNPAEILLVLEDKHKTLIDTSIEMHRNTGRRDMREVAWNDETAEEKLRKEQEFLQHRMMEGQDSLRERIMDQQHSLQSMIMKEQRSLLDGLEHERSRALKAISDLDSRIRQLDGMTNAISSLNSRIDSRGHQLDDLSNAISNLNSRTQQLDRMTNAISSLDSRIDSRNRQLDGMTNAISGLNSRTQQLDKMLGAISDLDSRIRKLDGPTNALSKGNLGK
ncbi:hypothetical protein BDV96DRAFT_595098 [Lophiotrema nucula]|uniref:DUF8212 domain-containing protein n=1 Tax=Lophiotrema nucula TaxID=690887 RepID=A0A6A5ZN99_9PLEO|nr:hypothetical protein BDV96DRAFT_595098 [Lophiotrema nucula]